MSYLPEPTEFELTPAGTHMATCYRVIDLGTQPGGQYGPQHKIMIAWELSSDDKDNLMKDGRPFSISGWYTWTMGEKSNLRKLLQTWRGRPFTAADFKGPNRFDIKNILGVPGLMTVVHNDVGEKTYANVNAVTPLLKGLKASPLINAPVYLWLSEDRFDPEAFDALHDKLKERIMASPEYKLLIGAAPGNGHEFGSPATAYNDLNPPPQDFEDAIPF